ncbi:MAG: glycoside hydrolase family 43 protein [Treponema sp.]|nr:glycoside hydrolase family 43 protein [Treponema sp.]
MGVKKSMLWRLAGAGVCAMLLCASCKSSSDASGDDTGSSSTVVVEGSPVQVDYTGPTYTDNYVDIASFSNKDQWNLSNVHDPTVFKWEDDGYYYMFGTDASYGNAHDDYTTGGHHFQGKRSKNLVDWEWVPGIMDEAPDWVVTRLNEYRTEMGVPTFSSKDDISFGYWAPSARVITVDGETKVRMYYSIVVDNYIKTGAVNTTENFDNSWTERAFIGVAETTNPNGGADAWEDKGFVLCSSSDRGTDYTRSSTSDWNGYFYFNAIDPSYFIDDDGSHWLVYGSWHSGFALVRINPATGKVAAVTGSDYLSGTVTGDFEMGLPWSPNGSITSPKPEELISQGYGTRIYTRKNGSRWQASEGPELIKKDGYYWLFFANDELSVAYQTRVVRATNIAGPYTDIRGHDFTFGTSSADNYPLPIVTHPYKFLDEDNGLGSCYGWVGISHCALFQDDADDWYYMSQQRLPVNVAGNAYSNAIMMGGVRKIAWTPSDVDACLWPIALPERYGGIPKTYGAVVIADIPGTWQHINLVYTSNGAMDTASELVLSSDGTMSGAFTGTWSFSESAQTLTLIPATGTKMTVTVAREIDWERNPRTATIVYAGIHGNTSTTSDNKTFWGKKGEPYKASASESDWTETSTSLTYTGSSTSNILIPAFSVTASEGFTIEFTLNDALSNYSDNDWTTKLLSYEGCYVTIPNLDPYNNTISGSTLTGKNAYPTANGATLESGYDYTFPWGAEYKIKITFSADEIVWYRDGTKVLTYSAGLWGSSSDLAEFVGYYATGLAAEAVTFNAAGMNITDLTITKGCN